MSLTNALSIALSGLTASTAAAQLISGNISNAQSPGYTDKSINLTPIASGSAAGGVEVAGYSRATNAVLTATLNGATSTASYLGTQNTYMAEVQSILDSTDDPPALSSALSNFQAAWTEYSASPDDVTLQKNVVGTGEALANIINGIGTQVAQLQNNVENDLSTNVTELNTALTSVQTLNGQIASALASGQSTVDLEDQRDQAVQEVSKYVNVTVLQRNNGEIALYTPGGTALLDGQVQTFTVNSNGNGIANAIGGDVTGELAGGQLQAITDFLSSSTSTASGVGIINKLQSQIENFANMFVATTSGTPASSFADIYNGATTNSGEQASSFFTANVDASTGLPSAISFAVNPNLVDGTTTVKQAAATGISNAFNATNLAITTTGSGSPPTYTYTTSSTFAANGLTTQGQTYSGVATAILSGFQQAANAIKSQSTTATTQQAYYQNSLSSQTGVNTDTELVNLTNWENSYAAVAHVISTIQSMFTVLENMVSGT